MGMGDLKTLEYEGLRLELCKPGSESEYHVWRIELTGGKWRLSPGLRLGMTRAQTVAVLGEPGSVETDGVTSTLHYSFYSIDGWLWVEFIDDKLMKVGLFEDWS